ncbi:hypothetical protein M758_1G289300 [Ceratodon purpureus]|nr:hypothetical protein M758_1G289300 [Ceratodon purpureus]
MLLFCNTLCDKLLLLNLPQGASTFGVTSNLTLLGIHCTAMTHLLDSSLDSLLNRRINAKKYYNHLW